MGDHMANYGVVRGAKYVLPRLLDFDALIAVAEPRQKVAPDAA
jgi:hypothetical protein